MEELISDRLQENLLRLKLTRAAEVLDTIVEQAQAEKSTYPAFLDHLWEEEVAAKEKRRVETAMKTAGLPGTRTIDEYDFSFHPKLNKQEVMRGALRVSEKTLGASPRCVGGEHILERPVVDGTAQLEHIVAVCDQPPCSASLQPGFADEFVG